MPYATAFDGTRIYYEEVGEGESLLLISGQGADHTYWDGLREDFSGRYRVIVYDNRGTGQSDKPNAPEYTTRGLARDAIAVLDQAEISRAHVYGHSMGGRIAQWLAVDYGPRLASLVLGATTPGNAHGVARPAEVNSLMAHPPLDRQEAFQALGSLVLTPAWLASNPAVLTQLSQGTRLPEYIRNLHYQASEGHDCWDELEEIRTPTLVIHGSDDVMNPAANAALLAEKIPGAELYIVDGGRHGYLFEFREESSRVVNSFFERNHLS